MKLEKLSSESEDLKEDPFDNKLATLSERIWSLLKDI